MNNQKTTKKNSKKTRKLVEAYLKGQILLAFIDQSYFKNTTNVARALYKPEMKNILKRTWKRFGNKCNRHHGS